MSGPSAITFNRPATPDQDEDDESQRSPTPTPVEIPDEPTLPPSIVEDDGHGASDQAPTDREWGGLQQRRGAVEERMRQRLDHPANPKTGVSKRNPPTQRLPPDVIGLSRTGTWIIDEKWRPDRYERTEYVPPVREPRKVQRSLVNEATQEDLGGGQGSRLLTPLPSFVTGDGSA